jgi:hypothetical protein
MKCPTCGENTPDAWSSWHVLGGGGGGLSGLQQHLAGAIHVSGRLIREYTISFDYMRCANHECQQLVIRGHNGYRKPDPHAPEWITETWQVWPRRTSRRIDPLVPSEIRKDYVEAAALLDVSPKMSAVLSRKIVFDLLESYAGVSEYTLKGSLDKFIADTTHPQRVRDNLQHLREIGDFGAHTKRDGVGQIIDVSHEDAEWTLDLIDRLFDYFIVDPERDRQMQAKWDKNVADVGRKPITPVPPDPEVPSE